MEAGRDELNGSDGRHVGLDKVGLLMEERSGPGLFPSSMPPVADVSTSCATAFCVIDLELNAVPVVETAVSGRENMTIVRVVKHVIYP